VAHYIMPSLTYYINNPALSVYHSKRKQKLGGGLVAQLGTVSVQPNK